MTLERTPAAGACARICVEQPEEALGVAEAAHPAQHRVRGVLEGQVEVRRDARRRGDRRRPARDGSRRAAGRTPGPARCRRRSQLGQQRLEQPQVAEVLAVGRGVLADQEQLADALLGQPARLGRARRWAAGRRTSRGSCGIAQNEQRRSQPQASLSGAIGPPSSRRRTARGPVAGAAPAGRSGAAIVCPGTTTDAASRADGLIGSSRRRSCGVCGWCCLAGRGSSAAGRRCRGSRRSRARRRPRAATSASSLPYRSARQPTATTAFVEPPDSLRSAASSRVSTESFFAASTKPQVFTTTVSASSGSSTSRKPPASRRPASSSESTSLRAQPSVTRATVVGAAPVSAMLSMRVMTVTEYDGRAGAHANRVR